MAANGISYHVDLALCIDATSSMSPVIKQVKGHALRFHEDVVSGLDKVKKSIDKMRVRVIAFRDFYVDGARTIRESDFFDLPGQNDEFKRFLEGISADGGGDEPESGLEALALAMRSQWTREGDRQRHVIVVWTDASTHPLEKAREKRPDHYPSGLPETFDDLTDLWNGQELSSASRRLLIFAPDSNAWSDISQHWENTLHYPSRAGAGVSDVDYSTMLDSIARSVGG